MIALRQETVDAGRNDAARRSPLPGSQALPVNLGNCRLCLPAGYVMAGSEQSATFAKSSLLSDSKECKEFPFVLAKRYDILQRFRYDRMPSRLNGEHRQAAAEWVGDDGVSSLGSRRDSMDRCTADSNRLRLSKFPPIAQRWRSVFQLDHKWLRASSHLAVP